MSYAQYLATHELFWAMLSGGFLGVAVALATHRARRSRRPYRTRSRLVALAIFFLALAVAAVAAGIILPANVALVGLPSLYTGAAALLVVGAAVRFPRAAGIPLLMLAGAAAVYLPSTVRGWQPVRTEAVVAEVVIVSMTDDSLTLELSSAQRADQPAEIVEQDGTVLRATVEELLVSRYLFLLGGRRFVSLVEPRIGEAPKPPTLPEQLYSRRTLTTSAPAVNVLQRYHLVSTDEPGSLGIVRIR